MEFKSSYSRSREEMIPMQAFLEKALHVERTCSHKETSCLIT